MRERCLLGTVGGEKGLPEPRLGGELILPLFLGGEPGLRGDFGRGEMESLRRGGE